MEQIPFKHEHYQLSTVSISCKTRSPQMLALLAQIIGNLQLLITQDQSHQTIKHNNMKPIPFTLLGTQQPSHLKLLDLHGTNTLQTWNKYPSNMSITNCQLYWLSCKTRSPPNIAANYLVPNSFSNIINPSNCCNCQKYICQKCCHCYKEQRKYSFPWCRNLEEGEQEASTQLTTQ